MMMEWVFRWLLGNKDSERESRAQALKARRKAQQARRHSLALWAAVVSRRKLQ